MIVAIHRRWFIILGIAISVLAAVALGFYFGVPYVHAVTYLKSADTNAAKFDYVTAADHIRKAAEFWPRNGDVRFKAARLSRHAGAMDDARTHLDAGRELLGDTEDVRLEAQLQVAQRGEATELAEQALIERAKSDVDRRPLIYEALVRGFLTKHQVLRAKPFADEWVKAATINPWSYFWRGRVEERLGGYAEEEAVADYRRALERFADLDEARERLADLLLKRKSPAEARPHFEEWLRRKPDDVRAMTGLARCRLDEPDAARSLLDRAIQVDPNHVDALRERAMLALNENKPAEAEPLLRRANELLPQDPYTSYNLMICLRNMGSEREAKEQEAKHNALVAKQSRLIKLMNDDLQKRPRDPDVLYEIGQLFLETGRPEYEQEGLNHLERALDAAPGHVPTLKVLAAYFERKGQREIAAQLQRKLRDR